MAKDFFHDHVRRALENDGWTITHDPFRVEYEGDEYEMDLGAERLIAAEKGTFLIHTNLPLYHG